MHCALFVSVLNVAGTAMELLLEQPNERGFFPFNPFLIEHIQYWYSHTAIPRYAFHLFVLFQAQFMVT